MSELPHIQPDVRSLRQILAIHPIPQESLEGAVIYDLGCGRGDLGTELTLHGIHATVIGFDIHPEALSAGSRGAGSTERRFAYLDDLPVENETADIGIANYSDPYWAKSSREIRGFFHEATRVIRFGGLLSVFPLAAFGDHMAEAEETHSVRMAAIRAEVNKIRTSGWSPVTLNPNDPDTLTVRKTER